MASNKIFRFGPVALTNTLTTDILKPTTAAGGTNAGSSGAYIDRCHQCWKPHLSALPTT